MAALFLSGAMRRRLDRSRALRRARWLVEATLLGGFWLICGWLSPPRASAFGRAVLGAIAFTLGSSIYFAPGQYRPETPRGQQVLGHELAHVLQQRAGRVRNPQGSGIAIVQDVLLEAEAEHLGARAAAFSVPAHTQRRGPTG